MMPKWHFLFGFSFSIVLISLFDFSLFAGLIIFLSSVFIDLDHALLYVIETKNINPFKFWKYSMDKDKYLKSMPKQEREFFKKPHFIFHGIEFIIILILLSFIHIFFFWILVGMLFHLFLDLIYLMYRKEDMTIKFSQILLWQKNKKKKKLVIK